MKDMAGNAVWFPKGKKWYFDKALQKRFYSKKQKLTFMNEHKIIKNNELEDKKKRMRLYPDFYSDYDF